MGIGVKELVIILLIVLILFGRGRITAVLGEVGKGIRAMKDGLKGGSQDAQKEENTSSSTAAAEDEKKA